MNETVAPTSSSTAAADEPIVITRDEANSRHVDDLLKRQMSLRGEGVTTEPAQRWFYRSWLLFGVVGALCAFGSWLILEPSFDDYHYTQGRIEAVEGAAVLRPDDASGVADAEEVYGQGAVTVRGQKVWLSPMLRTMEGSHAQGGYDVANFKPGQEVGLYAKYYRGGRDDIAIAHFVAVKPPQPASGKALEPLRDQSRKSETAGLLMFSVVAAMIGFGVGAADGIVCRLPRRALLGGVVGALVGFVGGLICNTVANVVYAPLNMLAMDQLASPSSASRALGFLLQMIARMFGWTLAGTAMGLGQGIALRSKRLLGYGFLGGIIGGLLGGVLFDPIDMALGADRVGADWSRLVGFLVIGAAVGAMIGVVELLARDAWLRMTEGPLAGKEFLLFRDVMDIGASPRSEIYLFNDPLVARTHATLRVIGDETELQARDRVHPLLVNGQDVKTTRLRHGDRITIGTTSFVFEQRQR
jgi:hypothetical protein